VAQVCDRVQVMYAGRVIESGEVHEIFHNPRHPYTQALLQSIPRRGTKQKGARLPTIPGIVPSLWELPDGCRFQERCPYKQQKCVDVEPDLVVDADGHSRRCHFPVNMPADLTVGATS